MAVPAIRQWQRACARRAAVALIALVVLAGPPSWTPVALAQAARAGSERSVKAAFVYKFLGYVEWTAGPADPDAPIVFGEIWAEEIAAELADIARARPVNNRPVEVRRLRAGDPLAGLQVLFIGAPERSRAAALVRAAQARGVLTITETDDGLDQGSVINLVVVEGRVRFEVALDAAERAGLKLSSRLLAVAHLVRMGN
jgi:hypothetical protein